MAAEATIPELPEGIVAVLATVGPAGPVAIPVSALVADGPGRLLFALARTRGSAARAQPDPAAGRSAGRPLPERAEAVPLRRGRRADRGRPAARRRVHGGVP